MNNPPKGYYRNLLSSTYPYVRIAFANSPIIGCSIVNSAPILDVLDKSSDPYAKFYTDGLRKGSLVTIVENSCDKVYRNNGELYFTT